ncbi:ABC transporter permease [Sulfurovum sp. zt1-1]|uniref:ABC transporter permease n=1 Tax=Sulfurovum zhangzhouensis TaxID=3019067 RepID=A0ABT7R2E1_9BACT|nr:ABC transporter permease [Sulfurovum zhangzhouensis]MDM5272706.1 ABC transporter permease [Sulfurovum zhangzhouensis]
MFRNAFLQALREIRRNLMRSLLTAVGIVIGIASVIAMVNIGKGASQSITQSVEQLGSNTLYIMPGQRRGPGSRGAVEKPFKKKDLETLRSSIYALNAISPVESGSMTVVYKEQNYRTNIRGVENEYFQIQNWKMQAGREFEQNELRRGQNVCILGQTVIDNLSATPKSMIGQKIRLKNFSCSVIGVLEIKGANTFGHDQDDVVLVPFTLFQRRIGGSDNIHLMMAEVKENVPLEEARVQIERVLRERRHIEKNEEDDFQVRSMTALLDTISQVTTVLTVMLGAVAAISLVVGGIGIMNIMLVSVTERTREIGIRMAVGAMAKDILIQFLIESIVLSGLGGVVGILSGMLITFGVAKWLDIVLVIDPSITVIALIFSMLIGIIFGIIPARKAAQMNPIDALRYE